MRIGSSSHIYPSKPALWSFNFIASCTKSSILARSSFLKLALLPTWAFLGRYMARSATSSQGQKCKQAHESAISVHIRGSDGATDLEMWQQHHRHRRLDRFDLILDLLGFSERMGWHHTSHSVNVATKCISVHAHTHTHLRVKSCRLRRGVQSDFPIASDALSGSSPRFAPHHPVISPSAAAPQRRSQQNMHTV